MSIPRQPAEIFEGNGQSVINGDADVIEKEGGNVTAEFLAGASVALDLCLKFNINVAVLAEFSPSCGSSAIYDGSFSGTKVPGMGVTAALLRQHGIRVFNQHEIAEANQALLAKHDD